MKLRNCWRLHGGWEEHRGSDEVLLMGLGVDVDLEMDLGIDVKRESEYDFADVDALPLMMQTMIVQRANPCF